MFLHRRQGYEKVLARGATSDTACATEAIEAGLVVDRGTIYELSDSGWLFYVNLMYYLMPNRGKQWITRRIAARIDQGHECEQTELNEG